MITIAQKPKKTAEIKFRCAEDFKYEIVRRARTQNLDTSDIVRMACIAYMQTSSRDEAWQKTGN